MEYDKHMLRSYENLIEAVIMEAAKDYRKAYKHRNAKRINDRNAARRDLAALEYFFTSGWFAFLSDADGAYIMYRIRQEVDKEWQSLYEPRE